VRPRPGDPLVLVVMGVMGTGKSTLALALADLLGWPFAEGDTLHPPENVAKMASGRSLTDADRGPWLERVAAWVQARLQAGGSGIITCSALKRSYRELIRGRDDRVVFVHLVGSPQTITRRLAARQGHFMPPSLLASQLADLERPGSDEPVIEVGIGPPPRQLAREVATRLGLPGTRRGLPSSGRSGPGDTVGG